MLTLQESIIKSNSASVDSVITKDPRKFAELYLKLTDEHGYYISNDGKYLSAYPSPGTYMIDDKFPKIEFYISGFGWDDWNKMQIIIKDLSIFEEHFRSDWGKCKLGGKRTDIIIDDPNAVIFYESLSKYEIKGRLIIKRAKLVDFSNSFPEVPSIILYRKNIARFESRIKDTTKLIEIR